MLTSAQCREKAEELAAAGAAGGMAGLEWETMAVEWLRLARMAEAQEAIEAEIIRDAGG